MYIVPIAWIYVALMMAVAEASSSNGTVLGALVTLALYGLLPVALVLYIMGTPGRKRKLRAQQEQEREAREALAAEAQGKTLVNAPDAGGHAPANAVAPMGKVP